MRLLYLVILQQKLKIKNKGKSFADEVLSILLLILIFIVTIIEIFTPFLVYLIAPGFIIDESKFNLTVELTRITFPFLLFVSLSSFFSGILNSYNKFAAAAAAPIILNIVLIGAIIISYFHNYNIARQLSYGVTIAGILQLIFLIYFTYRFYTPSLKYYFKISSKVKLFFKKLLPSIFSSGVTQINILVGTIIASFQTGAVSYLYYADRVYQINLAIAGIAVGTVSLPVLSKAFKKKNFLKVSNIQNKSLQLSLLFSMPASLGLIIASKEIVNGLFGYGSFTPNDVEMTSQALMFFGYGVIAFALIKILSNFFFARDNTKIPFYISSFIVFLNVVISLTFFKNIGFIIIPIATSISSWIGVLIFLYLLKKNNVLLLQKKLFLNTFKIIISSVIMSIVLVIALEKYSYYLNYTYTYKSIYLLIIVGFAGIIYLLSCYLLGLLKAKNYKTN